MFDDHQTSPAGFGSTRKGSAMDRMLEARPSAEAPAAKPGKLDSEECRILHGKLMAFYQRELHRQAESRVEQSLDEDFYDGIQWSQPDADALKARGQMPLVYNMIATSINWLLGTERRTRTDYKILPRRKDAAKAAERKTQLFKYNSDQNQAEFHRSRAFEDAVKVGIGWMECGAQQDDEGEPVYDRYEGWRNMLWDSAADNRDLTDARYIFRSKWLDLDVAIALFPERRGMLIESAQEGDGFAAHGDLLHGDEAMDSKEIAMDEDAPGIDLAGNQRKRVRVIEAWFKHPAKAKVLRGGEFSGERYEDHAPGHQQSVEGGGAEVIEKVGMRMHVAFMTTRGLLYLSPSPYRHNAYPFTPIWGYRRGRDNMPYGVVRGMRGVQEDINKRASKALHILSTNKTIMDEGAVDDLDAYLDEVSRPDAVIVKKPGKELVINAERELAPAHEASMSRSILFLQSITGITDEAQGRTTNATAGVAIQARQQQAGMATSGLFDNLRLGVKLHGEKKLSVMEQFMTEVRMFRITNMRGTPEYVTVNDGLPENDIARSKADFIISEDDWRASQRQAAVASLMDVMVKMAPAAPQLAMVMLDLIVESMDIPNRDELVKRIRQISGMRDPDAEELSPEEVAQAQQQQKQAAMQEAAAMAEIEEKKASAMLKQAQAKKAMADIDLTVAGTIGMNVASQKAALEAALLALTTPPAAAVGDAILHESGFASRTQQEADSRAQAIMEGEAEQAQAASAEQEQAAAAQEQQAQAAGAEQAGAIEKAMAEMNPVQREEVKRQLAAQQAAQQPQPGAPT